MGSRGGPKAFPVHIWPDTPSSRELVASTAPAGVTRSAIGATPASQATSPTWSRRRCKGHVLPDLAAGRYHRAEPITRDIP